MRTALALSVLLAFAPVLSPAAAGEGAYLVRDLTGSASTFSGYSPTGPDRMVTVGRKVFFLAGHPDVGAFVWVTDGTIAGTRPLGEASQDVRLAILGSAHGALLWSSPQGGEGGVVVRLWRSDGTLAGTRVLAAGSLQVWPGTPAASLGGLVYFVGCSTPGHCELWRSDGTDEGTALVKDVFPDPGNPSPQGWGVIAGKLYFTSGSELLASDGTAAGTSRIADIGEEITGCAVASDKVFLATASDELWASDGTAAGTRKLRGFAGGRGRRLQWLKPFGGHVDFLVDDEIQDRGQLWRSDGTAAGTQPMTALRGDDPFYNAPPEILEEVNGRAVFFHFDEYGRRVLSSSSGTPASTTLLAYFGDYGLGSTDNRLVRAGDHLVFAFQSGLWSTDGTHAGTVPVVAGAGNPQPLAGTAVAATADCQLWQTDGTAAGSRRLARSSFCDFGGGMFVAAILEGRVVFGGVEDGSLQVTDGTPAGSHVLSIPLHGSRYSEPLHLVAAADRLFFNYGSPGSSPGREWVSQGTAETTLDLPTGPADRPLLQAVGASLFLATEGPGFAGNAILTRTDGTAAGTADLADLGDYGSEIAGMVAFRGELYFSLAGHRPTEIWKSDGTVAGTGHAFDLPAEAASPDHLTALGDELYFVAGGLAWRSDGTSAGTRSLQKLGTNPSYSPPEFTRVGAAVYFVATDPLTGSEVWKTDGTAAGTALLADVEPGDGGSNPSGLTELGGKLYFFASFRSGTVYRRGLWRSDGTTDGTVLLADLPDSSSAPAASDPTVAGGLLFFLADDGVHGRELWKSDGTAQGTAMVRDIFPGAPGAFPDPPSLAVAGGRLYFAADDGVHGRELWQSDGTAAGTRLAQDIAPGSVGSDPDQLTVAGDRLYFAAYDEIHGRQLWALPFAASGCRPAADHLCLQNGRFEVRAEWRDFQGHSGQGTAVGLTGDTGTFWFFSPSNVEVVVKVLDGRGVNQAFWVFYGALSSVEYTLSVTDTETGLPRRYFNPAGTLASVGDTDGFGPLGAASTYRPKAVPQGLTLVSARTDPRAATGGCTADAGRLCLQGGRFAVTAEWKDFQGHTGNGTAVGLTGDTGYFWFFSPGNVEVVAKVLDGRAVNDKFWLFYGALSSVEYTLTVTDTQTGSVRMYENASGNLASVADTSAF